jgi:hypothetical protein
VTTSPQNLPVRWALRALALTPAVLVTTASGAASADAPDSWQNPPSVSPLHTVLVLVVIPVGLFVLITLLVCLPSMSRNQGYQPGQAWRGEPEWFGGPRAGLEAVDDAPPAVTDGRAEDTSGATAGSTPRPTLGGASGRW